jgi:hypothetical protein
MLKQSDSYWFFTVIKVYIKIIDYKLISSNKHFYHKIGPIRFMVLLFYIYRRFYKNLSIKPKHQKANFKENPNYKTKIVMRDAGCRGSLTAQARSRRSR